MAAPNFLYAQYVQLVVLKAPGRTPLPAATAFGRDSVFLTFHANLHCTWYASLCLMYAVLQLGRRVRSRPARAVERVVHRFTTVLFPLAAFVGLAYYLILHFHPMNRLRAVLVPDHDAKMALLHLNPLLFALGDSLLKDADLLAKYAIKQRRAVLFVNVYGHYQQRGTISGVTDISFLLWCSRICFDLTNTVQQLVYAESESKSTFTCMVQIIAV
ncbi:unnamed protein product [Agarophyton chilense]